MRRGEGAVAIISSMAGMQWRFHRLYYQGLIDTKTFEEGVAWIAENGVKIKTIPGGSYSFSKECICAYGKAKAAELAPRGIRFNVLTQRHGNAYVEGFSKQRRPTCLTIPRSPVSPLRKKWVSAVFLNSSMASFYQRAELTSMKRSARS
jgi:NAD(P)-dependent dehydrogenase (short-subunit alcohol dehydrogenase family)